MSVVCFISCASKHVLNYVVVGEWGLGGGGEAMGGGGGCRLGVGVWGEIHPTGWPPRHPKHVTQTRDAHCANGSIWDPYLGA